MLLRFVRRAPLAAVLSGTALFSLALGRAEAQMPCPTPAPPMMGSSSTGTSTSSATSDLATAPSLAPQTGVAAGGESFAAADSAVGYIDSAVPRTQFRLRYDAAYNDNRPDRAEFFYPKCGCFRTAPAPFTDPNAPGPPLPESRVDYQDISSYFELSLADRLSAFIEVPVRFLNPEVNADATGIGDINVGGKFAFIACEDRFVTFQFRTYIPTGDAGKGLGTDHVSLEPALLVYQRLTDQLLFEGEVRDWIPIGGTDFAGNVLRYGAGLSYEIYKCDNLRIAPVAELVGWSVLGGKEFIPDFTGQTAGTVQSASGDFILNAKAGVRVGFGEHSDFYAGYGRALTGEVWYKDIIRVEYRLAF